MCACVHALVCVSGDRMSVMCACVYITCVSVCEWGWDECNSVLVYMCWCVCVCVSGWGVKCECVLCEGG